VTRALFWTNILDLAFHWDRLTTALLAVNAFFFYIHNQILCFIMYGVVEFFKFCIKVQAKLYRSEPMPFSQDKHVHKGNNSWGSLDSKQYYIGFSYCRCRTWYVVEFNCAEILIICVTSRNNNKWTSSFPFELWIRYLIFTTSQKTNVVKEFRVTFVL